MIPYIPKGGILLFDRGYPSFDLIHFLKNRYSGHFLFRCPAQNTFPAVETFVRSDMNESMIHIEPSGNFLKKAGMKNESKAKGCIPKMSDNDNMSGVIGLIQN